MNQERAVPVIPREYWRREEDGVVDGVEGGAEVKEDEDSEEAGVSREK